MAHQSEIKGILKSGILVSIVTIGVKIFGLLKQMIVAWTFGATNETDIYNIADGFVGPIAVVLFSSISVLLLSEYLLEKKSEKQYSLTSNMYIVYIVIAIISIILLWIVAPYLSKFLAIGYSSENVNRVAYYVRGLSFLLFFYCIASINGAILEAEKSFVPTKLQGAYISISIIISCLLFSKKLGINAILYGTIFGYFLYFISNTILSSKYIHFEISSPFQDKRVWKIFQLSIPLMVGSAIDDIQGIIDRTIASGLGEGVVSNLGYGRIVSSDVISGAFISAVGIVFYSYFTGFVADNDIEKLKNSLTEGLGILFIITGIVTVLYLTSASEIVELLFHHYQFDEDDVRTTALLIIGYAVSFPAMAIRDLHIRAHYAFQDTKAPMLNGIVGMILNTVTSVIFAKRFGPIGIALGTSVSYFVIAFLSIVTLKKHISNIDYRPVAATAIKIIVASLVCFLILLIIDNVVGFEKVLVWLTSCLIVIFLYFAMLKLMKIKEVNYLWGMVKSRIQRLNEFFLNGV